MMRVHVERDWASAGRLLFWITRDGFNSRELLQPGLDGFSGANWLPLPEGATLEPRPEPSFAADEDVWTAMLRASEGMVEPTAAAERHLSDAIAVRDRVMTLLENELEASRGEAGRDTAREEQR